ncbi:hypothetical protein [Aetokthonos hydrillicola]|nr:hypothetical protein [Aetokthonos hydrillicola CCALA 1050]MBW4584379.1 hypothetical protein [Aetokthonos hydrillicola CCALA 1050]
MVSIVLLLCSGSLIAMFGWLSMLFICNPDQLSWLNRILPEWAKISLSHGEISQTIPQIESYLRDHGKIAGEIVSLDGESKKSFLLPVLQERENCQLNCKYIVEMRVYQQSINSKLKSESELSYDLATQLPISGPEESFVLAPLGDTTDDNQDPLPLTKVGRFEGGTPSPGLWFYLQGQRQQGTNAIAYGHILHYNPQQTNLRLMLSWTSPKGQLPEWQSITGKAKQLVVNQTIGLEPRLHIYQVKPVNPIQLEEISLTPPALKDSAYQNALLIARSGLWTPAFNWLEFMKTQRQQPFPATAQAQIDLIHLHSQLTKIQADKSWASPSQQVLANLIDGRWEKALQVFEASPDNAQEITTLLKADTGRLWNRVEAALKVKPNRSEVKAWGALILAAKFGQERANSWIKNQEGALSREQGSRGVDIYGR